MAAKYFPFLATLFFFILFSNFIGLIPLPTNTEHPIDIFGVSVPSFALYAATANISIPLVLTLVVWIGYNAEGVRTHGFFGYMGTLLPAGIEDMPFALQGLRLRDRGRSRTSSGSSRSPYDSSPTSSPATCCCCSWAAASRSCSGSPRSAS